MSLRILEDKRKFKFHKLSPDEKDKIVTMLSNILNKRKEIILATIFGGFVKSNMFRDVDIAVFTGYSIPYEKAELYEEELSKSLESIIGLPADVKVIDYAPSWFRIRALEGVILVERAYGLVARLKFKSVQEVLDLKAKYCNTHLKHEHGTK